MRMWSARLGSGCCVGDHFARHAPAPSGDGELVVVVLAYVASLALLVVNVFTMPATCLSLLAYKLVFMSVADDDMSTGNTLAERGQSCLQAPAMKSVKLVAHVDKFMVDAQARARRVVLPLLLWVQQVCCSRAQTVSSGPPA